MLHPDDITRIEKDMAARGVTAAEFCRRAEVAPTTWWRWKAKRTKPSFEAWQRVQSIYADLTSDAA